MPKYNKIPKPVYNDLGPSSYGDNPDNYKTTRNMYIKHTVKRPSPAHKIIKTDSDEGYSSSDSEKGGNFIKSLKKGVKSGVKIIGSEAAKTIGREGAKNVLTSAGKYISSNLAPIAAEALPAAEEAAPLMLMAAGMKNKKRKPINAPTNKNSNKKIINEKLRRVKIVLSKLK